MCVVSMIGDHYHDKWKKLPEYPGFNPFNPHSTLATKEDVAVLRLEVLEMKELLKKAIEYDKRTNQPHCEVEEKLETLRKVAEMVGVDLEDVLGKNNLA